MFSTEGEEKYVTILKKVSRVSFKDISFLYRVEKQKLTEIEDT